MASLLLPAIFNLPLDVLAPSFARTIGIVAFMPGLSAPQVPSSVRIGLAFGICIAITPALAGTNTSLSPASSGQFGLVLIAELGFGAILGYGASLLMEAARLAGELIDLQIGLRVAELYDPVGGTRSSLLGTLYYLVAVTLFLQIDGHHWVLAGLQHSFEAVPVGHLTYRPELVPLILGLCKTMFDLAFRMGAPVVGALLLTDIAFGLIVRAVPQVNILFVGMPAKLGIGFAGLAVTVPILIATLTGLLSDLQAYIHQVLRLLA